MELTYASLELINRDDLALAKSFIIGEEEVRRILVEMPVDKGAYMLAINECIQEQMQFPLVEKRKFEPGHGHIVEYDVLASIEVKFKNRRTNCSAVVLPGNTEPLLGAIPLEDMDVLIHPYRQELIENPDHPYFCSDENEVMGVVPRNVNQK